jgi:hypothetical protein
MNLNGGKLSEMGILDLATIMIYAKFESSLIEKG